MIDYSRVPQFLQSETVTIPSFIKGNTENIDWETVQSFGDEWKKFNNFTDDEIEAIGDDYFDIVPQETLKGTTTALDVGCGSGRWAKYLSTKVKFVEAIDPSDAVISAVHLLKNSPNTRVTHASVNDIPFPDNSFDLVYSLGVLHHIPDTQLGIKNCVEKVKPGGWLLLYLYYNLDNRGILFKTLFSLSNVIRKRISTMPHKVKLFICDLIAISIYLPLVKINRLVAFFSKRAADKLPLSYYRKTSFKIMRNDALDRFGTPLEKRFSRNEIEKMLHQENLTNILFSENKPYWHVVAQKP